MEPLGRLDLDYLLDITTQQLQRFDYQEGLDYDFREDHVHEKGEPNLARPSYNLMLFYGDLLILEICYEIDLRFSLEVRKEELDRIENLLATRAIGIIGANGIITIMNHSKMGDMVLTSVIKESEDKKFLGLN
jgi:hypothetical protein